MTFKKKPPKEKFIHRDLSWLMFNDRVLNEAGDSKNPLLEQVKFLAIFVNNLDEFFMVRVAGLVNLIRSGMSKVDRFGAYPQEILEEVKAIVEKQIARLYKIYLGKISSDLAKNDIYIKDYKGLKKEQRRFVKRFFETNLYPIVTPMAVDPGHPFPVLPSKTIAFAVHLSGKEENHLAIIPIPKNIPRLIKLPSMKNETSFILVDDVIRENLKSLFRGYKVVESTLFRVIRDSELSIEEEFTPDLLKAIEEEVRKRTWANAVYMEVEKSCSAGLLEQLCEGLSFAEDDVISIADKLDLTFLFQLLEQVDRPDLTFPSLVPAKVEYENIFERIKEEDFITHLPYQSFYPTVNLIQAAAKDENVLAIKMTLYRTNKDSAIIQALQEAALNKKQVTVLVEIMARFDEENNIKWVKQLEEVGCHVIYGIPGLKIHSKIVLVVRKEEGQINRYVHLSTGNYNENTAKVYTDIGYFTANDDFAKDLSDVFNVITGYSMPSPWKRIVSSPHDLRDYFYALIEREITFQKKNKNGSIKVKINSLEDTQMIEKLYEASCEGVKIELMVRGICSLIPGVKGMSENIEVKSFVGRFLEHSRIYCFGNNGSPRVFLSSADWMARNLDRRIELLFEIYNEEIKENLREVLQFCWKDNMKSSTLGPNREYTKQTLKGEKFNFQEHLIQYYAKGDS